MLDCKMTSTLSPVTSLNILSESYMGIWEQDAINLPPMKLETSGLMDLMDGNSLSTGASSPSRNLHYSSCPRDGHFHSPHYLSPLSSLGDPYTSSECQMPDSIYCINNMDTALYKFSEVPTPYGDNYENFIPDVPQHHSHLNHGSNGMLHGITQSGNLLHGGSHVSSGLFANPMCTEPNNLNQYHPSLQHHEYIWDDLPSDSVDYIIMRKGESPPISDSISYGDIDSEIDSKSSGGSLVEVSQVSPPKRKVGRPPKKDKKLKRNEKKTGRLWEFIRDLLKNPEYCPSLVRWENPEEGHFRFVNSEKVAQLWGQIKGNPRMTYEKLSRAMRYYYKSHVFEPVLGRRLVYKFGYNAVNWRPVNPNFVTIQKLYN